jgi:hypothetical protein
VVDDELRKEEKADAPELHQAGAPYDDLDAAARPARPRSAGTDPPPRRACPPSIPQVNTTAAAPLPFPHCCRLSR